MRSGELSTSSTTRLLCSVQMWVLVGNGNGLRTRKNRLDLVLSFTNSADNFVFRFDGFGGGELAARNVFEADRRFEIPRKPSGHQDWRGPGHR